MPEGLRSVYIAGTALCACMILLNLALVKKRGNSALALAGAFGTMGLFLYTQTVPELADYGPYLASMTIVLLIVDAVLRVTQKQQGKPS